MEDNYISKLLIEAEDIQFKSTSEIMFAFRIKTGMQ
jgi:hypothetical protein